MEAEDLLDKFAQHEGFGNWDTVVLNCHHSVIRSVAIAAVNQALHQPHVSGAACANCGNGKPLVCAKCYETESNFRESY